MNSNVPGFDPTIWGPSVWFFLHTAALRYPIQPTADDKKRFGAFIRNLQYVLPCTGCCKGFATILQVTGFGAKDLKDRKSLFAWTVKAHSLVNKKLGKPERDDPVFWYSKYMNLSK